MATFTVSIPVKLKKKIEEHPQVNWPEYLKKRFEIRLKQLNKFQELLNKNKL